MRPGRTQLRPAHHDALQEQLEHGQVVGCTIELALDRRLNVASTAKRAP
jgi:hypothetical protein